MTPRLTALCERHGQAVAWHLEGYGEAHGAVVREALRLGASQLPDDILTDLERWIGARILAAHDAAEPAASARFALIARVEADLDRHFLRLAAMSQKAAACQPMT